MPHTPHAHSRTWRGFGPSRNPQAEQSREDVEGAIGLWLWSVPGLLRPRSGPVSVWRDEEALHGFVARHDHIRIMRAYRERGDPRSTTRRTDPFGRTTTQETARTVITKWCARPAP
ncbi:hypothetical protein ACFWOL_10715 [Streptomyces sp. NPDC058442]|uniref:hypothetical protein n=1 Tax=Streptomyces sp. NPDC058442 TaxID=3346503 RepID=UPI003652BC81